MTRRQPDMSGSRAKTATEYKRHASRQYGYARLEAGKAARWYKIAESKARQARWLTRHPDLWEPGFTPAAVEADGAACSRLGDVFLRSYFMFTDQARFYAGLARDYAAPAGEPAQ
jgi:hypothetical protein